jgi:uncharacterized protein YceH (UPF0502 family)
MLRGPQTPGELKQRSERLYAFETLAAVHETLDRLVDRELVLRHPRRPGQKEDRYEQLLGGGGRSAPPPAPPPERDSDVPESRLDRLERELTELREQVASLRSALGE